MLKVGSKFYTFEELSKRLEEFQKLEQVQLWVRDSRTVVAAAKRARRKSLNPALKYAELTYSCVFGGRRPSDQTKIHNQTSAGGCPFKVRLSTSNDGQALVVKEICHDHNHEPGKKLHEEPRRLYKKTPNRTTVRKPVRYIVNKQRVISSSSTKIKNRLENPESHIQLGQSPFHHLHLHQQQYQQQQQQIKLQLQQHLQHQQQQQQQLRQKQAEVIQLDSPDHIDTPDHLSSPDLSTTFDLGSFNNSVDQYTYLPPSPISPSLSGGCPVDCEEDERLEPILDLEEALEEALGDLDSVGSMEIDANLRMSSLGSTSPPPTPLLSHSEAISSDEHTGPPPAKRQRGRPRKQSFTGTPPKGEKAEKDNSGEQKEEDINKAEEEFLGFSSSMDKAKSDLVHVSRADVAQANAMARQLHVYKPGIDFVPGARLEVLDARDNNWYQCKVVEVDWGELDILVHYERWSNRFDEWLKMDSTRIRPLVRSSSRKERRGGPFRLGDRVAARWAADGKRYQAKITKVLGDDQFEILFYDGVTKVVRSSALHKIESKSPRGSIESVGGVEDLGSPRKVGSSEIEEVMLLSPSGTTVSSRSSSPDPEQQTGEFSEGVEVVELEAPSTPVKKSIFDVEIIDQKRKPKRKAAVEQLFQSLKKKRRYEHHGKKDDVEVISPKVQKTSRNVSSKKTPSSRKKSRDYVSSTDDDSPMAGPSGKQSESAVGMDTQDVSCESPLPLPSSNTIIVDHDNGWKKGCVRRSQGQSAGKWDVFFITPEGKKIRTKNELLRFAEETGSLLDVEPFDFTVKSMKDVIEAYMIEMGHKELLKSYAPLGDFDLPKPHQELKEQSKHSQNIRATKDLSEAVHHDKSDSKEQVKELLTSKEQKETARSLQSAKVQKEMMKSHQAVKDQKEPSKNTQVSKDVKEATKSSHQSSEEKEVDTDIKEIPLVEIKDEDKTDISDVLILDTVSSSQKADVKKSDAKSGESSKLKIEIPIISRTDSVAGGKENEGESAPGISLPSAAHPPSTATMTSSTELAGGPTRSILPEMVGGPSKNILPPIRTKPIVKKEVGRDKPAGYVAPNEFVVRSEHNEHQCPKPGCGKSFRKENLLQMHIKHYHPEIHKKGRSSVPNVADLAYARTVGDHLDMTSSGTPSSPPVEKIKSETSAKKLPRGTASGSSVEAKSKTGDKRGHASSSGMSTTLIPKSSKDAKKKEPMKTEPSGTKATLDDGTEIKEELEEYIDDLEEEAYVTPHRDPDYNPIDSDIRRMKDKKERRKTRSDSKTKKRKSVPSESMSEDDVQEQKAVAKYRYSKRKGLGPPKTSILNPNGGTTTEPSNLEVEEDTTDTWAEGPESVSVQDVPAEIINCGCGSTEEEGLMLQCDVCMCWQHGACYNIVGEDQVPDKYICSLCDHPRLERSSHKFRHHQDWLKEGRLPRFSFSRNPSDARLEACVRRGHELTGNVLQLSQVIHSLRLKLHISKEADHPKLFMWHKKWNRQEDDDLQNRATTSDANAEMVPLHNFMNLVGNNGSDLQPVSMGTSMTSDPTIMAAGISVANELENLPSGSSMDLSSAVFSQSEQMESLDQKLQTNPELGEAMEIVKPCTEELSSVGNKDPHPEEDIPKSSADAALGESSIKTECSTESTDYLTEEKDCLTGQEDHRTEETDQLTKVKDQFDQEERKPDDQKVSDDVSEGGIKAESSSDVKSEEQEKCDESLLVVSEETKGEGSSDTSAKSNINEDPSDEGKESEKGKDEIIRVKEEENISIKEEVDDTTEHTETAEIDEYREHTETAEVDESTERTKTTEVDDSPEHTETDGHGKDISFSNTERETKALDSQDTSQCPKESTPQAKMQAEGDLSDVGESKSSTSTSHESPDEKKEDSVKADDNMESKDTVIKKEDTDSQDITKSTDEVDPQIGGDVAGASHSLPVEEDAAPGHSKANDGVGEMEIAHLRDDSVIPPPQDLTDIDLPQADDDNDSPLDDGDELALDLGGLGSGGEGGMPGGSDLAALLSSQSELEQLVTQASSALAPHVPSSAVGHCVQAPIIPEAERIEPVNCKLNLLEHVQVVQTNINKRFDQIERQLEVLEAEMGLSGDLGDEDGEEDTEERDPATLQARALVKLILNDINTVKKIADFTH